MVARVGAFVGFRCGHGSGTTGLLQSCSVLLLSPVPERDDGREGLVRRADRRSDHAAINDTTRAREVTSAEFVAIHSAVASGPATHRPTRTRKVRWRDGRTGWRAGDDHEARRVGNHRRRLDGFPRLDVLGGLRCEDALHRSVIRDFPAGSAGEHPARAAAHAYGLHRRQVRGVGLALRATDGHATTLQGRHVVTANPAPSNCTASKERSVMGASRLALRRS